MRRSPSAPRWFAAVLLSLLVAALVLLDGTQAQTDKGKKYALLVGVLEYDSSLLEKLKYAENDVEELGKLLSGKLHRGAAADHHARPGEEG
jgi:hypothetical protein